MEIIYRQTQRDYQDAVNAYVIQVELPLANRNELREILIRNERRYDRQYHSRDEHHYRR